MAASLGAQSGEGRANEKGEAVACLPSETGRLLRPGHSPEGGRM